MAERDNTGSQYVPPDKANEPAYVNVSAGSSSPQTLVKPDSQRPEGGAPRTLDAGASESPVSLGEWHLTPDQPYIAETDSGYKLYPKGGEGGKGIETIVDPNGAEVAFWDGKNEAWGNISKIKVEHGYDGLNPDTLSGLYEGTSVERPELKGEAFNKGGTNKSSASSSSTSSSSSADDDD